MTLFLNRVLGLLFKSNRIVKGLLARVPDTTLRNLLGRDYLSPVQQFALDGYNDRLFKGLPLDSGSTVIVLGGYLGDSVAKYREIYDSTVYSTEPILEFFSIMQKRFYDDRKVFIANEATTGKTSEIELFISGSHSGEDYLLYLYLTNLLKAAKAKRYESRPKPAMLPWTTPEITEVWRNSSRDKGLLKCTSMQGALSITTASRIA